MVPSAASLIGCLMLGNLMRESGVVDRLSKTVQNELMNIVTIFLGISVGAVNTEPVQEFLYHISTAVQVGVFRQDITTEEGVDLTIYHMPEVSLEDRDGRAILLLDGEETDITDALAQDGHYTFQQQSEGTVLDLTVTGSVQDWTLTCSVHGEGEEGPVYTYTGGGADSSTVTVDTGDEVSGVVSVEPKESGLTAASVTPAG